MPGSGERYGRSEQDLSVIRDSFVREFLGEDATNDEIARAIGMLVHYEQRLIDEEVDIIELYD